MGDNKAEQISQQIVNISNLGKMYVRLCYYKCTFHKKPLCNQKLSAKNHEGFHMEEFVGQKSTASMADTFFLVSDIFFILLIRW